jgi:amidase
MAFLSGPTMEELKETARRLGLNIAEGDLEFYRNSIDGTVGAYNAIATMNEAVPTVKYPRMPGYQPTGQENKYNAWYRKSEIRGAATGKLKGKTVVLKDNVCVAGVPMMNGASTLEGYVPEIDATVVTRLLDAGATIVGKAHCEYFCFSGGSHTSAHGPVVNPRKPGYSAGGSSSGSGALLAAEEVDLAIGGDQGGSIRIPSSFCGVYGMKPTHGLVPYTGIMPIELTLDHTGPMSRNVSDNALMLEVIAGPDGLDPRQINVTTDSYTKALTGEVSKLRIGVVKEGFGLANSEPDVDGLVRKGVELLGKLGAQVEEVSIPLHALGIAIWTPIAVEGATMQMMHGNGFGFNWKGLYVTSLMDHHANWRARADELSESLKVTILAGEYILRKYQGRYYAKCQNLSRVLRGAYDSALTKYDLLLMPTLPIRATPIPGSTASKGEIVQRALEMLPNTSPFDVTGHPAMSIPCGLSDGRPVGLMLIGKHCNESTIYGAAYAFEQSGDWMKTTA